MDKVKVKIKANSLNEFGQVDVIESMYKGKVFDKNGKKYITYSESDLSEKINTTIKISDQEVEILKFGSLKSKMNFIEGKDSFTEYRTTQGMLEMKIYTYKVMKKINKDEIRVNLDYKVEILGLSEIKNRVEIKVVPIS